jgi:hypothetical protein
MRIFNDLADRPSLREMCSNPLILSMYVARDQAEGGVSAPESRTEFYMRVVEELVIRRRASQLGPAQAQAVLRNQRLTILGRIAHNHLLDTTGPTNLLHYADVISIICTVIKCNPDDAELYLRELSKETGILTEERERESCRFIHLTFCEFLAHEAVHGSADGWEDLMLRHEELLAEPSRASHARLIEVIPFACALLPRYKMPDALSSISRTNDQRTLTMAFLETKIYDQPTWYGFAIGLEANLLQRLSALRHHDDLEREWLADVVLFVVVCKDEERARRFLPQNHLSYEVDSFFQKLNIQAKSLILPMIASYAEHDAVAASRMAALCQVNLEDEAPEVLIDGCDQPPLVAFLVDQAQSDGTKVNKIARLLAEAGLRSPAARATLVNAQGWTMVHRMAREAGDGEFWFGPPYVPANLFTGCLTIAVKQHKIRPLPFEMGVSFISDLPPVRIMRKLRFFRIIAAFMSFPFYVAGSLAFASMLAISMPAKLVNADPATPYVVRALSVVMVNVGLASLWDIRPYFVAFWLFLVGLVLMSVCLFGMVLIYQITKTILIYRAILGCPDNDQKKRFAGMGLFKLWSTNLGQLTDGIGIATHLFFSPRSRKSFEMLRRRGRPATSGAAHPPGAGEQSKGFQLVQCP